jgi:hypothetical protein
MTTFLPPILESLPSSSTGVMGFEADQAEERLQFERDVEALNQCSTGRTVRPMFKINRSLNGWLTISLCKFSFLLWQFFFLISASPSLTRES